MSSNIIVINRGMKWYYQWNVDNVWNFIVLV